MGAEEFCVFWYQTDTMDFINFIRWIHHRRSKSVFKFLKLAGSIAKMREEGSHFTSAFVATDQKPLQERETKQKRHIFCRPKSIQVLRSLPSVSLKCFTEISTNSQPFYNCLDRSLHNTYSTLQRHVKKKRFGKDSEAWSLVVLARKQMQTGRNKSSGFVPLDIGSDMHWMKWKIVASTERFWFVITNIPRVQTLWCIYMKSSIVAHPQERMGSFANQEEFTEEDVIRK